VSIDKTWKDDAATDVNDLDVVRQTAFDFFRSSDGRNHAVADEHSAILNDGKVTEFGADARPFRAGKRDQLGSV